MFEPLFLVPAALLTGVVGIGHFVYGKKFVSANDELKRFEYRMTGRFCLVLCALALIGLVAGKLIH